MSALSIGGVTADDYELLSMMSTLEAAASVVGSDPLTTTTSTNDDDDFFSDFNASSTTKEPSNASSQFRDATSALVALKDSMLLNAQQQTDNGTLGGSNGRMLLKSRLSNSSAVALSALLLRHPALQLDTTDLERQGVWQRACRASIDVMNAASDESDVIASGNVGGSTMTTTEMKKHAVGVSGNGSEMDGLPLSIAGVEGVRSAFVFAQLCSDDLERERLKAVFRAPDGVIAATEERVRQLFGMLDVTAMTYPDDPLALPHRMWLHCLFGPLMSLEVPKWSLPAETLEKHRDMFEFQHGGARGLRMTNVMPDLTEISLPMTRPEVAWALERVSTDPYDTAAWLVVIEEALDGPLESVRPVLYAAAYRFPTCGELIVEIASKELAALNPQPFAEGDIEAEAKQRFVGRLRLLNLFYRHLPMCTSWRLYDVFITFLEDHVCSSDTDDHRKALDRAFRVALSHVEMMVDSTPLWLRYLEWRSSKTRSNYQRREFTRKLYKKMLFTPLEGLGEVRERYLSFENMETSTRPVDPSIKQRMDRAFEIGKTRSVELRPLTLQRFFPKRKTEERQLMEEGQKKELPFPGYIPVILPRPLALDGTTPFDNEADEQHVEATNRWARRHDSGGCGDRAAQEERSRVDEQFLWLALHHLITAELDTNASASQKEDDHFKRVAFWLSVRASSFPHEAVCWVDWADLVSNGLPAAARRGRRSASDADFRIDFGPRGGGGVSYIDLATGFLKRVDVLTRALTLHPQHLHFTVLLADTLRSVPAAAGTMAADTARLYMDALRQRKVRLLKHLRGYELRRGSEMGKKQLTNSHGGGERRVSHQHLATINVEEQAVVNRLRTEELEKDICSVLSSMMVLVGNWMKICRFTLPTDAATQIRLVARHAMHDVGLLDLTTEAVRVLCSEPCTSNCVDDAPYQLMLSFNSFCVHWIEMELHQIHSVEAALLVWEGWCRCCRDAGFIVEERLFVKGLHIGRASVPLSSTPASSLQPTATQQPNHRDRVMSGIVELAATLIQRQQQVPSTSTLPHRHLMNVRRWALEVLSELDLDGQWFRAAAKEPSKAASVRVLVSGLDTMSDTDDIGLQVAGDGEQQQHPSVPSLLSIPLPKRRSGYWGVTPMRFIGDSDYEVTAVASRSMEGWIGDVISTMSPSDVHVSNNSGGKSLGGHRRAREEVDDAIRPDLASWIAHQPAPRQHYTPRASGGNGGRGGVFRRDAGATIPLVQNAEEDVTDETEGYDDAEAADGDGGDKGPSEFINVGGALLDQSQLRNRAKVGSADRLQKRFRVQLSPVAHDCAVTEGLSFTLDHLRMNRSLEASKALTISGATGGDASSNSRKRLRSEAAELGRIHLGLWGSTRPRTLALHEFLHNSKQVSATVNAVSIQENDYQGSEPCDVAGGLGLEPSPSIGGALLSFCTDRLRGTLCLEDLICRVLPSRYAYGAWDRAKTISVSWLVEHLSSIPPLVATGKSGEDNNQK